MPFARALAPALKASRPLFHDTTPVIQNQLRPFSIAVQPLAKALAPAAAKLAKATPPLNALGRRAQHAVQRRSPTSLAAAQQGYLFWGSWLAHIADSLTDAAGRPRPDRARDRSWRTCRQLNLLETTIQAGEPVARRRCSTC